MPFASAPADTLRHAVSVALAGGPARFDAAPSPARQGWQAKLDLAFEPRFGRTAITRQSHLGPLRVQRPFYPEPNGTCHVYVLHPPGGVVGGDLLEVKLDSGAGSRALVTTPGASKLYRSLGAEARIRQRFDISGDACLEWFPQETIAFEGAHASIHTHVQLAAEASYAGWEIVCLGRPAAGERFNHGLLRLEHRIERAGKLQWIERAEFRGGDAMLEAAWGMAGHAVIGTFVIAPGVTPESKRADPPASNMASWVDELREALAEPHGLHDEQGPSYRAANFAITLVSQVLVLRYLGDHAHQASSLFRRAWKVIRPRYAAAAVAPRIWHT
jgi:urease accessory protein